ncbi:MAG: LLM class flavin-dependent oxidoreductase [Actinomycetota bacterium]
MRLGLTPPIEVMGFREAVKLCAAAEGLGYTDVWTAEVGATDAFSPLAAIATSTERVRLGTAVVPIFTRPAALTAMSAAGIQQLSGGRFALGIGTSSPAIVGQWMGLEFDPRVRRVEEYVEVLREALAGKKVTHRGETLRSENFRLQVDPGPPVPIFIAALGPRMCRLAGRVADGVLFYFMSPDGVRRALEDVAAGAREAGRDPGELDVFIRLPVAAGEDEETARFMARRLLTGYAIVPAYNASLARQGFEEEAAGIAKAWAAGERDRATELFSDRLLDEMFVIGEAGRCRSRIDAYRAAGVRTPVVMPLSFAGTPEERSERVADAVRALAPGSS